MSRTPRRTPPPTLTPIASTSTAHLASNSKHSGVRRRYEQDVAAQSPPAASSSSHLRPLRRKRRDGSKRGGRLRWRKGVVTEAFRKFGEHCARNQIRTLLIDCLVMTNLFYPSLALYLQKKFPPLHPPSPPGHMAHRIHIHGHSGPSRVDEREHPLSLLSTPVLDSFFPYPPPLLPRLNWAGWWGRDTGQYEPEGWGLSRALPQDGQGEWNEQKEVRVMRVGWADVEDILDRDGDAGERSWEQRDYLLLRLVRDVAEEWETRYRSHGERCVRRPDKSQATTIASTGPCYILSPDQDLATADVSITPIHDLSTQSHLRNSTELRDSPFNWLSNDGHIYHSTAVLFHVPRNITSDFENRWCQAMTDISKRVEGEVFIEAEGARAGGSWGDQTGQWYLSYTSDHHDVDAQTSATLDEPPPYQPEPLSSSPPKLVLFFYVVLFTTLIAQLSNASKVHSRFGLAFTGVVQLCCSSVMSFSVLALLGWNGWLSHSSQSSLPTYVLPFVIVVVGAENMSTLTKAIFSIPFNHSVPVRIGLGLSKVGTTIALTSLTDLAVLGIVWLCVNLQPIREFCLFAAVVIITDWFMLHTFFLTVLSIDAQRLELADVLASNGVAPHSPVQPNTKPDEHGEGKQGGFSWRRMLRARTTKSGSLILLLMTVGLLYWLTERHRIPLNTTASLYGYTPPLRGSSTPIQPSQPTPFFTTPQDLLKLTPAESLWRALNPLGWPYARIFVPPASIVVLPKAGHPMRPADIRKLSLPASRLLLPRLRPLFYLFKVVVLPQALTAGALYALLLYLLKDADLLDAQRDRLGRIDQQGGHDTDSSPDHANHPVSLTRELDAYMLPCSHESDVDVVASSSDGLVTLSVGIDNTLCLWRFRAHEPGSGTRELLPNTLSNPEDPIVAAAVEESGQHIAVCTESGMVQIWDIEAEGSVTPLLPLKRSETRYPSRITALTFDEPDSPGSSEDPFTATPTKFIVPEQDMTSPTVLVASSDGSVFNTKTGEVLIPPETSDRFGVHTTFVRTQGLLQILMTTPESVHIYRRTSSGWLPTTLTSTYPEDRMTAISSPIPAMYGLYAIGHRSGVIELIDENIGPLTTIAPSVPQQSTKRVELHRPSSMRCLGCGTISSDGYLVVSSTISHIYIDRVAPQSPTSVFCKCTHAVRRSSSLEDPVSASSPSRPTSSRLSQLNTGLVVPPSSVRKRYSPGSSPRKSPSLLPPVSNGEFPLSSHGGSRRLSNLHRLDDDHSANSSFKGASPLPMDRTSISASSSSPAGEMDVSPLGAISTSDGAWAIQGDVLIGIRRINDGIDDSQWSVFTVDLTAPFNGSTLVVDPVGLGELVATSAMNVAAQVRGQNSQIGPTTVSMRDRRTERIHSLNGRASFPERAGVGSFSVPTFQGLGYVEIREFGKLGKRDVIAGFGNKLGILHLPESSKTKPHQSGRDVTKLTPGGLGLGCTTSTPLPASATRAASFPTSTLRRQGEFPLAPPPSNVLRRESVKKDD
ncbi:hypothetical protein I317_01251 [Kwoniella heveanensis CBS 569]|nr:hypothetical protein I317_01251 [Kwoniella heveanensis CBS 569]